jgi:DNA-directed RNA polymerase subunit K/omega
MSIKPIEIVELESKAGNLYEAIIVSAKRARQLNEELKFEYNTRLEPLIQKDEEDENIVSKDKMNISLDFEKREKPTETGINQLLNDELEFRIRTDESD